MSAEDRFCGNCGLALQPAPRPGAAAGGTGAPSSALAADAASDPAEPGATTGPTDVRPPATPATPAPAAPEEPADDLQPTLIEASHGGQAAAPARAPESADPAASPRESAGPSADVTSLPPPDDTEVTADTSDEQPTGTVTTPPAASGETTSAVGPAPEPETATPAAPQPSTAAPAAEEDRRRTGDLPSRQMAYTGRTGGSRRAASQLDPGTVLHSRYEIVKRIGGGGMGAVYYAKDRNLGDAPRAVKEMIQTHLDESQQEKAVADFRRESMLLASLEHASIPTIYDYFYDDTASRFYLVMKYISGGDCLARLRHAPGGRLDELTVADWGMQAADVLEYLHNQRPPIIYRDLKPANLMIDGNNGRVMLI
ncbi:MAG TPA: protein kinase, partial [Pyrinomonadaceae bacterium]